MIDTKIVLELSKILGEGLLQHPNAHIQMIGYCPDEGYRTWLAEFKGQLFLLDDQGNGWYCIITALNDKSEVRGLVHPA